jgi:hypothetical protein
VVAVPASSLSAGYRFCGQRRAGENRLCGEAYFRPLRQQYRPDWPQDEVLDKTSGQFVDRKNIYQQLWCLPKVDGKYIQVCTFTVGGNYGGTCLRGDDSLVVKKESDIEPLIVLKDKATC